VEADLAGKPGGLRNAETAQPPAALIATRYSAASLCTVPCPPV